PARLAGGPEHDAEIAPEGALQAAPGIRPEVAVLVTPSAMRGWAICISSDRGPAPRSSIASRLIRHDSLSGPYRPSRSPNCGALSCEPLEVAPPPTIARPPMTERSTKSAVTPKPGRSMSPDAPETTDGVPANSRWGANFDPDRLALLELRMWKAYYRRQPARLFGWLVL